jgi:hypothetical protein
LLTYELLYLLAHVGNEWKISRSQILFCFGSYRRRASSDPFTRWNDTTTGSNMIPSKKCFDRLKNQKYHTVGTVFSASCKFWSHKTSLTTLHFIEIPVPNQESERSCIWSVFVVSMLPLFFYLTLELFRQCGIFGFSIYQRYFNHWLYFCWSWVEQEMDQSCWNRRRTQPEYPKKPPKW